MSGIHVRTRKHRALANKRRASPGGECQTCLPQATTRPQGKLQVIPRLCSSSDEMMGDHPTHPRSSRIYLPPLQEGLPRAYYITGDIPRFSKFIAPEHSVTGEGFAEPNDPVTFASSGIHQ